MVLGLHNKSVMVWETKERLIKSTFLSDLWYLIIKIEGKKNLRRIRTTYEYQNENHQGCEAEDQNEMNMNSFAEESFEEVIEASDLKGIFPDGANITNCEYFKDIDAFHCKDWYSPTLELDLQDSSLNR